MKTVIFLLVVIIIGGIAWYYYNSNQAGQVVDKITITDTMVVFQDSVINLKAYDTIPSGFYQGMLPCKNCEGIQRTIMFADYEFKMEELSLGKGMPAKRSAGTWGQEKGKFLLSLNDKVVARYRLVRDSLINMENYGVRIPDSLYKLHVLFKKNTTSEHLSWKKRYAEGIDIVGTGSEPYWSIEIDNEKLILFKVASEKPVIVPIEKPVVTRDSTVYSIRTEAGAVLKVSISSKFCNDGISDHLYEYKMTVWYKSQMYKGCAVILNTAGEAIARLH